MGSTPPIGRRSCVAAVPRGVAGPLLLAALLAVAVGGCSGAIVGHRPSAADAPSGSAPVSAHDARRTVRVPCADAVRVSIIGDSYTSGSLVGGNGPANWTEVARQLLAADGYPVDLAVLGLSGSGYVRVGGTGMTFTDAIPGAVTDQTQLVVVFGSINDGSSAPAAVASSAALALAADRSSCAAGARGDHRAAVDRRQSAGESACHPGCGGDDGRGPPGVQLCRPAGGGLVRRRVGSLIGSDGLHPTDAGHRHLAELIAPQDRGCHRHDQWRVLNLTDPT